jgi:hypothetical protein
LGSLASTKEAAHNRVILYFNRWNSSNSVVREYSD